MDPDNILRSLAERDGYIDRKRFSEDSSTDQQEVMLKLNRLRIGL